MSGTTTRKIAGIAGKDWLLNVTGMKVFGDSLLTERVRKELSRFAWVLLIQLIVDLWVWTTLWSYALPSSMFWSLSLGTMFALLIFKVDQGVITHDTSSDEGRLRPIIGRAILLLMIALITALAVELGVFATAIDRRLDQRENIAVTELKETEIAKINSKYQKLIDQARADGTEATSHAQTTGQQDVESYKSQRATERASIEARYAADKKAIEDQIAAGDQRILDETKGRFTGRSGIGPMVIALQQEKEKALGELSKIRQAEATELGTFDTTTAASIASLESKRDTDTATATTTNKARVEGLQMQWEDKVQEIREMNRDRFATIYGGDWKQDRGFLTRFHALQEMASEDSIIQWLIWGTRLLMMIIGMAILILKLSSSREFVNYFSYRAQIAAGNPDATAHAEAEGYNDPTNRKALAWPPETLEVMGALHMARLNLCKAWRAWWQQAGETCKQDAKTGLCRSRDDVATQLRLAWNLTVQPMVDALATAEREVELNGRSIPRWDETRYPEPDPRNMTEPWDLSDTQLRGLGWEDPSEKVRDAQEAVIQLPGLYRQIIDFMATMDMGTRRQIRTAPATSLLVLEDRRFQFYHTQMRRVLEDMEDAERKIASTGRHMPERPRSLRETDQIRECWRLDRRTLRDWGWQQDVPRSTPPAPAPVRTPAPTTTSAPTATPPAPPVNTVSTSLPEVDMSLTGDDATRVDIRPPAELADETDDEPEFDVGADLSEADTNPGSIHPDLVAIQTEGGNGQTPPVNGDGFGQDDMAFFRSEPETATPGDKLAN
ncbi:MAG TPA: hypothetical protein DCS29_01440 [Candidatus Magasanikbacteria bacterium]|nr:hypothetical protein [Candidatus Magasanikbacteria bacterium]